MEATANREPRAVIDAAALAVGHRLATDRFPRRDPGRQRTLAVSALIGVVVAAVSTLALEYLAEQRNAPVELVVLFTWLAAAIVALLVIVPFAAEGVRRAVASWRRRRAGAELGRLSSSAGSDPDAAAVLRAYTATLASAPFRHVEQSPSNVAFGMATAVEVGPVGGLLWGALLDRSQPHPQDAADVLDIARVIEADPAFPLVVRLVDPMFGPLERARRAAATCTRAARLSLPSPMVTTLAAEWDGTLDELDEVFELLASAA